MNAMRLHKGNLFKIKISNMHRADMANLTQSLMKGSAHELGHRQLEHLNVKYLYVLQSSMNDLNLGKVHFHTFSSICEGCIEGKQLRATFPNDGERRANKPLEIAHSNIFGRMRDMFFYR